MRTTHRSYFTIYVGSKLASSATIVRKEIPFINGSLRYTEGVSSLLFCPSLRMSPSLDRLSMPAAPLVALFFLFAGGIFDGWFSSPDTAVAPEAIERALHSTLANTDSTGRVFLQGDWLELDPIVSQLYASREFAPLWVSSVDRVSLTRALSTAPEHGISLALVYGLRTSRIAARIARLNEEAKEWEEGHVDPRPALLADFDVLLTHAVLRYADALSGSRVDPAKLFPGGWYAGTSSLSTTAVRSAVRAGRADQVVQALDALHPTHTEYGDLQDALARLHGTAATWTPIPDGGPLSPGERSIRTPYLRGHLGAFGYLGSEDAQHGWDASDVFLFDEQLAGALNLFLIDRGLASDSVLTDAATEALNVDINTLIETVEINLERWRWLPSDFGDLHVLVNLPSFELNVRLPADGGRYRNGLTMPAVIGMVNAGTWTTPVMSDTLESIVFHPSWSVPRSIQANSIIPQARADSGTTLPMQGFDVYAGGAWVDPTMVDWDAALPGQYRFVQRPGRSNPMGRIKFVMPNDQAIIIHDTNNRGNFARPSRTFSNGCIHAGDARALAEFLLHRTNGWNAENVDAALRRGGEWVVPLDKRVPTHLLYFTAWAEPDGRLRIYNDVYGRDRRVRHALGYDDEVAS